MISGLAGLVTATTYLALSPVEDGNSQYQTGSTRFGGTGMWFNSNKKLMLETTDWDGLAAKTSYAFAFDLVNPTQPQASPAASICAHTEIDVMDGGRSSTGATSMDGVVTVAQDSAQAGNAAVAQGATAIVLGTGADGAGTVTGNIDLVVNDYIRIALDASSLRVRCS